MPDRVPVRFEPSDEIVWVEPGVTVLQAATEAGVLIPAPCGGRGVCGSCGVRVVEGSLDAPDEYERLGLARAPEGVRLACRARVLGPATVRPLVVHSRPAPRVREGGAADRLAAGVDLGTTTVSATVVDLQTGREIGRATAANRQQGFGADVITRLAAALAGEGKALREAAEGSVLDALATACAIQGCDTSSIESLAIAGNTAMAALLLGEDVAPLAQHPFGLPPRGVASLGPDSLIVRAIAEGAATHVLPPIASFVGGDTTAALIATRLLDAREPVLLVDLGTNAEVVLASERGLWVTSAAAGPAFEGAGTRCGGPATDGGVVHAELAEGQIVLQEIGPSDPLWFTGSGLLSAITMLRRTGHLDAEGLLSEAGPLEARFSRDSEGVLGLTLAPQPPGSAEACLRVDQRDVRAFQIAKAAVRVAVDGVIGAAGLKPRAIHRVMLAGAFGAALDPEMLVELGVLPERIGARTRAVGDAALDGAVKVALAPELAQGAVELLRAAHHLDLAADPRFNERLMAAIALMPQP